MTRDDFDQFCSGLPATTNVIQWGNASVWKVGGKIFAICSVWGQGDHRKISFKCSDMSFRLLCEQENIGPAPYLGRYKWVQLETEDAMTDEDVRLYIDQAYRIVVKKLTKARRAELGLSVDNS